ncbi:MAG: class I adenylate-forming enzyme family protein [Methanocorpusculum sp.]|nr:class I adenylate-forming enzyme family protein [Methanocorpusculum sp.]
MGRKIYKNDSITTLDYSNGVQRSLYSMFEYGTNHGTRQAQALIYFNNIITYGEMMDAVHECAAALVNLGVKKGDCVTIFLPNIPQCLMAIYAVNRIGAVCNMVHPLSTKAELDYAVNLTESKIIFAFETNEGHCKGLNAKVIRCRTPEYFPKNPYGAALKIGFNYSVKKLPKIDSVIEWTELIKSGKLYLESNKLPDDTVNGDDTAVIMYTGGTTGDSKGVMLSNAAMNYAAVELLMQFMHGIPHIGATIYAGLPAFHAFGFVVAIHLPLAAGLRLLLLPRFNTKQCAKLFLKEQINYFPAVPVMYERLYPLLKGHDLSFVRFAACGGDLVSLDLVERYNELFDKKHGGAELRPGYGLTEVAGCCLLTKRNYKEYLEGSVGSPIPQTQICLVEPGTTNVVKDNSEGELCIINPAVMKGYYKNEKATSDVMRKHDDGQVWLHTGDVVSIVDGDNVIFKSRYKRMVKINGINVYPTLIENTMSGCSLVNEVCAVAVPWKNDRRIKLYVTLTHGADKENAADEIMDYAKANLNHWSTPTAITILDSMPMTKMSKTDYRVLEKRG